MRSGWNGCWIWTKPMRGAHRKFSAMLCADSKPRMKALTLSQIEARIEDPTIALKQLIKEHKCALNPHVT